MSEWLARIRPGCGREVHIVAGIVFNVGRGWYEIDESIVDVLRGETVHELRSPSGPVFEVRRREEAIEVEELAKAKIDIMGTPEKPVEMTKSLRIPGAPVAASNPAPIVEEPKRRVRRALKM